jgi:hypothetical protein
MFLENVSSEYLRQFKRKHYVLDRLIRGCDGLPSIFIINYHGTLAISTHVCWIINEFWNFHFNKWKFPKYSLLSFTTFFDLEKIIFENFNISKHTISIKLAKILGYCLCCGDDMSWRWGTYEGVEIYMFPNRFDYIYFPPSPLPKSNYEHIIISKYTTISFKLWPCE